MELETLEVIIDANLEKLEAQYQKIMPGIERVMGNLERVTGQSINRTEKSMNVEGGVNALSKQYEKLVQIAEKQLNVLEKLSEKSAEGISKGFNEGMTKARKSVNKDVDELLNDINVKMGKAKAEQEKLAFLKSQRQDASAKGDTKNVVKYDSQIARAQEMMGKYQSQAKKMADSIKAEFNDIPQSLDKISDEMAKNERVIESQKAKVRELTALYEQQAKKVSKLSPQQLNGLYEKYGNTFHPGYKKEVKQAGFKYEDNSKSLKTKGAIEKQQAKIQKLISKNDQLQRVYAATEDKTASLRAAIKGLNTELGASSVKTGNAALGMKKLGNGADRSKSLFSKFGGVFNRTSNNIAHGSRRMSSGMSGFGHRMSQMIKQVFVFGMIYKGLMLVNRGLFSALKTNDEFNNSLNQIKVNLLTAFYPIYEFVLPAINAMMRALASVTGQIAHFTASLFGTTYTAAKQGASGLYQNIQAMNDSGNAADKSREKVKKLQRSLMGFDEIHRIGLEDDKDDDVKLDKPSTNFNTPIPAMPNWIGKANSVLADFFKPFQDSWAKHGQSVINAWNYALKEIIGLAGAIGNSFMEVWTNGTGERFISNILILLAEVLNLVGDIAKSFREAWEENDRGTKLIQAMFDLYNDFLELTYEVTKSFRNAWNENELGKTIIGNMIDLLTELLNLVGDITKAFKDAWIENERGTRLIQSVLGLYNELLELAFEIANSFRNAWNENKIGQSIIGHAIEIVTNLIDSVKLLGEGFKNAWKENNVGVSIFSTILGAFDGILSAINEASKATKRWAGQLDFRPLLKSIDKLLKPIKDISKDVFDVLAWAYENVLLPLAKLAIEDVLPMFFNVLGSALEIVANAIKLVKPLFKWLFEQVLKPIFDFSLSMVGDFLTFLTKFWEALSDLLDFDISSFSDIADKFVKFGQDIWNGLKEGLSSVKNNAEKYLKDTIFDPIVNAFKKLFGIHSPSTVFMELGQFLIEGLANGIEAMLTKPVELVKKLWDNMSGAVVAKGSVIWESTKDTWDNVSEKVSTKASESWKNAKDNWENIKQATGEKFEVVKSWTKEKWDNVATKIKDTSTDAKKNATARWEEIKQATGEKFEIAKTWTREKWENIRATVSEKANNAKQNASSRWEELKQATGEKFETTKSWTREKWENIRSTISEKSNNAKTNALNSWENMRRGVNDFNERIKTNTSNAFNNVVQGARELGGRIKEGLHNGVNAVVNGAKAIANGLKGFPIKAVNAVKNGVGWVLGKLGAKNSMGGDYVVNYAQGTGYHRGGAALVNDGYGANYQEAYRLPNGQTGLFPKQRNLMVNLPAGSSVLSGPRTAAMMNGKVPKYANGVGNWFKKQWDNVKEFSGDVWDYMSHPSKLVEAGVSKFVNLKGAIEPALSMSKGAIATSMDAATDFVKNKMEELFDSGDADTSTSGMMGVMQYLSDIAKDVMRKFPGMVATSGYRHGDPYYHGKRQAIDIAYPSSMNGSSAYFEPANYVFNKFRDKVAYVITQGMVKDRVGLSGTGASGSWVRWPDNDHYDHLHINGSVAPGQGGARGGGAPKGSGSARWAGSIRRAASMMGQSITPSQVNGIIAQIELESGGNENVIQSNAVWDVNTAAGNPARGLLQYIPQTFNAFRVRGYGNIMNGFHQLMAFFNNTNWRGDIQYGRSGWGPRGGRIRPYAKGTPYLPEDQLAMVHKGEMIVPASYNPMNPSNNFQKLKMPSLFTNDVKPTTFKNNADTVGGGMNGATEGIINAVMMALDMRNTSNEKGGDINIKVELEGEQVANVVVNEVNKKTMRQGKSPLMI